MELGLAQCNCTLSQPCGYYLTIISDADVVRGLSSEQMRH